MEKIRDMIVDDIRQAQRRRNKAHILMLLHVLHRFLRSHPEVCPPQHPWSGLYSTQPTFLSARAGKWLPRFML